MDTRTEIGNHGRWVSNRQPPRVFLVFGIRLERTADDGNLYREPEEREQLNPETGWKTRGDRVSLTNISSTKKSCIHTSGEDGWQALVGYESVSNIEMVNIRNRNGNLAARYRSHALPLFFIRRRVSVP